MTVIKCDMCEDLGIDKPAVYDAKTVMGPWANLCDDHMELYGCLEPGLSSRINVVNMPKPVAEKKPGKRWPEPTEPEPTEEELEEYVLDSVCPATDGCDVEPDGVCPHGHPSWLRRLGLI